MAGISFLAVDRELFEVILFYETLWTQGGAEGHGAVLLGIYPTAQGLALPALTLVLIEGGLWFNPTRRVP